MKRILTFLLIILISATASYGQKTEEASTRIAVSGKLINQADKTPLVLAQISVRDSESKVVAKTKTFDDGIFRLKLVPGQYTLFITHTGHKSIKKNITVGTEDIDLGTIKMQEGEEIQAAGITSESLLRIRGDRVSYDVSKDPDRNKINMMAMMEKIPQLKMAASNGKLEFNGEALERIFVDDDEHGLITKNRQYPMEFIKAGYMKTIEVIMPGSQEYHNERPILRIKLAKKLPYGFAGNLSASASTKNTYSPGVDLVGNIPNLILGAHYKYTFDSAPSLANTYEREMSDGTIISGKNDRVSTSTGHSFGINAATSFAEEKITFRTSLGCSMSDGSSLAESYYGGTLISSKTGTFSTPHNFTYKAAVRGYFGPKKGKRGKHQWNLEYSFNNDNRITENTYKRPSGDINQIIDLDNQFHTLQGNVMLHKVKIGKKEFSFQTKTGWYRRSISDISSYGSDNESMIYNQDVLYAEIVNLGTITDKLGYGIHLKADEQINRGMRDGIIPIDYNDFTLIPSIDFTYTLKRGMVLASWTKDVKRPKPEQLYPHTDYSDPNNITRGNPNLKGQTTDRYHLGYSYYGGSSSLGSVNIGLSYMRSGNMMSSITEIQEDGTAVRSSCNLGRTDALSPAVSLTLNPFKSLSFLGSVSYNYQRFELPDGSTNVLGTPMCKMIFAYSSKLIDINGFFNLSPFATTAQTSKFKMEPSASISVSRYFKKPHLGCSVSVEDLLHRGGMTETWMTGVNFTQHNLQERRGRTFMFNLYWRFGKFKQTENIEVKAYDM